ncbi:MAG: hypothetical protein Kow00123_26060 [Anaerolineales bacterium]
MSRRDASQKPFVLYDASRPLAEQDCACAGDEPAPLALHSGGPASGDTDCACAEASASAVALEASGAWKQAPVLYRTPLAGDCEAVFNAGRPSGVAVLNRPAADVLRTFCQPRPLRDETSRQLAMAGLLVPADAPQDTRCPADAPATLTAWLHITNACNLRCTYCYVQKDGAAMDEATGRSAVEAILRSAVRHGFRAVKLKYAGGEPTLNFALVRRLHAHASDQAEQQGLALRETLITNGVNLADEVLAFAAEHGIRLAVSLDMCPGAHDSQRARPENGTYERVRRNIERAVQHGLRPHVSITVTGADDEVSADAVRFALGMGLPFNLNFVRPPDGHLSDAQIAGVIRSVRLAFAEMEANPPFYSLLGVLDRADFARAHSQACGAGRSYLVVDHLGRVSPCQMRMGRTVGDVGMPDPLAAVRAAFANPPVDERGDCAECTWRYACGGGCPLLGKPLAGGRAGASPYCAAYRTLYPELIRLEGFRVLKLHGLC